METSELVTKVQETLALCQETYLQHPTESLHDAIKELELILIALTIVPLSHQGFIANIEAALVEAKADIEDAVNDNPGQG